MGKNLCLGSRLRSCATLIGILLCVLVTPGAQDLSRLGSLHNGLEYAIHPILGASEASVLLVFRAGAEAQTAKTAGLFKLVESILFRGSVADPGEPEPAGALETLQVSNLEGGTSLDRFSIGFSVDPALMGPSLYTLAALFSDLRIEAAFADTSSIEKAKAVMAIEQGKALSGGEAAYEAAFAKKLFSAAPWRLDIVGSPDIRAAATAQDLRAL
ncbi:MAG TPA: hypothetical protein VIO60_07660, partial [Rectinemataceae bacterium]